MDHHYVLTLENDEALDFTSGNKKIHSEMTDSPVLDLSCKKQSSSCVMSPLSIESSPSSLDNPCDENSYHNVDNYVTTERKSPLFEGRNFMVTPPSETDSPKKQKKYTSGTLNTSDSINNRYPLMPASSLPIFPLAHAPQNGVSTLVPQNSAATLAPPQHQPQQQQQQLSVSSTNSVTASMSSITHDTASSSPMSPETGKKVPRPFKAYPKDPLSLSVGNGAELMYDQNSNEAYSEFRKRMLDSVRRTNEGTNIKMRRVSKSPGLPTSTMDDKDSAYWERRRKNNEAAKRSRDARRAKEDEIAIRAAFLEQENMKLKYELVALRNETAKLRCMIYTN